MRRCGHSTWAMEGSRVWILKDLVGYDKEFGNYPGAEGNHGTVLSRNMALILAFQKHDVF